MPESEQRMSTGSEARAASGDTPRRIGGYAANFDVPTVIGGMFREVLAPGCFGQTLARGDDVLSLFNHDQNFVLGRTSNRTLTLSQDNKGLAFEVTPPETSWASDLMTSVERGDITACSFAFIATREEWDESGEIPTRTILQCDLYDQSVVSSPAYQGTSAGMRSSAQAVLDAHKRSLSGDDDADRAYHLWQARKRRFELGLL